MNKIQVGGQYCDVLFFMKIPYTKYWLAFLKGPCWSLEVVKKGFDNEGYYFYRKGYNWRPEKND